MKHRKPSMKLCWVPIAVMPLVGCGQVAGKTAVAARGAPAAIGAYFQGIRAGNTVYVAGQIALDPRTGKLISDTSIEAQTQQVLENLRAILEADGMTLDNVVSTQVFVRDIDEVRRMNAVYGTSFGKPAPAHAVVEVSRLPRDAGFEIAATAVR
jgi:2-iminobutanoate/2-iminopropanoate deaminase